MSPPINQEIKAERSEDDKRGSVGKNCPEAEEPKQWNAPKQSIFHPRGHDQPSAEQTGQCRGITPCFAGIKHQRERGGREEQRDPGEFCRNAPCRHPDQDQRGDTGSDREDAISHWRAVFTDQHQPKRVQRVVVVVAIELKKLPRMLR